jgi:signal transduction histidine kinase
MGMGVDISERVKLQQELDKKTAHQQRKMTKAVIAAQEAERTQLGQELHDNVNQVLTTIKLYTEMLRDGLGDSGTIIEKSIYHLQKCINEIRSISKKLSAPTLGNLSLVESIKELAESINLTKRINIIFNIEGFLKKDITSEIHMVLYRIVQEELKNIINHAEASYVAISLKRENQYLTLTIKDDGKGFDIKTNRGGNGLYNMKTRAESIGGTFNILSTVGTGCEIMVRIPIFESTGEK